MNRYEQRRRKLLMNKEVAAGYEEMAAELELTPLSGITPASTEPALPRTRAPIQKRAGSRA